VQIRANPWATSSSSIPPQSDFNQAGTAFFLFHQNPAAELISKAEQLRRQSVLIRANPWATLPLQRKFQANKQLTLYIDVI